MFNNRNNNQNISSNRPPSGGYTPPQNNQGNNRQYNNQNNGALKTISSLLLVFATVLLCVFLAIFSLSNASDFLGINQENTPVELFIPENITIKELTDLLGDTEIIDHKFTFKFYANLKEGDLIVKPGDYTFNKNMAYQQIFRMLKYGDLANKTVDVTIPEGFSLDEIAKRLEEKGVCKADEFLSYLQTMDISSYQFADGIPETEHRYLRLEGYLFPDTYQFYVNDKVENVADKILGNFDLQINQDMRVRLDSINMTLDQIITIASIIEKEASGEYEYMQQVSSVFHNRLDSKNFPHLQSDATIYYANDHIKNQTRTYTIKSSQDVLDAYNTYVKTGLPEGPIANPGLEAINAALYPTISENYYFISDNEGNFHFARNLAEHDQNIKDAGLNGGTESLGGTGTPHGAEINESDLGG